MSKLRHIAIIVEDPEASAKFFEEAFDMKRAGTARRGIYMSDGIFNVALLKKENDKERLGLYHFGMWVDDLDEAEKKVVNAGGEYLAGRPTSPKSFYEAKYKSPTGLVFDLTHTGWAGAVKDVVPVEGARTRQVAARPPRECVPWQAVIRSRWSAQARSACALRWRWRSRTLPSFSSKQMTDGNFLDQVPRAGSNHPTTLEFFDRIGLYEKMEPRGLIAPKFHYWDRQDNALIAEFDHALLKDDTRFPYVLQCERIKIIEEALKLAKAHPLIEVRMATEFTGLEQKADAVLVEVRNAAGERETIRASYLVSCEGARSIARKELDVEFEGFTYPERTINIEVAYDFRKHGYTERNYISDPVEYSNLFHWKGPPDRWRIHFPTNIDDDENELKRPRGAANAAQEIPRHRPRFRNLRLQPLHGAPARRSQVPRRPRGARGRRRPRQQPDRRHGIEQRRARRVQPRRQAGPHPAWRSLRCGARQV